MCLKIIDTRPAPRPARPDRLLRRCSAVLLAVSSAACTSWLASPETLARKQAEQALEGAVQERADMLARQDGERTGTVATAGTQRVIAFAQPAGATGANGRGWPVMRVEQTAVQLPPQLVLEGPVRGVVFLDAREIGLVQEGAARVLTLAPGEHRIRIEHPQTPAMTAEFYIETGERIRLRWENR